VLGLLKRHEVQVLRRARHSQADVARLTGVSLSEVRRIDAESPVENFDDAAERRRRGIGRPSKAEPFRALLAGELARDPGQSSLDLLKCVKEAGYSGGKSALYALVAELRSAVVKSIGPVGEMPGDLSQHGFGEADVRFADGGPQRVHFLVSQLLYSRWHEVSIVRDRGIESLLRGLVDHFARIGGVPLAAVFELRNAPAIGANTHGFENSWDPAFAQAMLDIGVGFRWHDRAREERSGGGVENLVRSVTTSFFRSRRFADAADLQSRLGLWTRDVNSQPLARRTKVIPAERIVEERRRLRPLAVQPEDFAVRIPVVVGPGSEVIHEGISYPMPAYAIGKRGTLYLYSRRVVIAVNGHSSEQDRQTGTSTP
jgi:hypothetical protein